MLISSWLYVAFFSLCSHRHKIYVTHSICQQKYGNNKHTITTRRINFRYCQENIELIMKILENHTQL